MSSLMSDNSDVIEHQYKNREEADLREEITANFIKAFRIMDKNSNGYIENSEIKFVVEIMGLSMND